MRKQFYECEDQLIEAIGADKVGQLARIILRMGVDEWRRMSERRKQENVPTGR